MIEFYILTSLVFLISGMTNLHNNTFHLGVTRSRETKGFLKVQIKRDKNIILFSSLWPGLVLFILRDIIRNRDLVFVKNDENKKKN